jgi:DNA-directed RNA polymerase specialized sigma24 family protein
MSGQHAGNNGRRGVRKDNGSYSAGTNAQQDRALVDACLSGDVDAWEALYYRCHDKLLVAIRRQLGPHRSRNFELADEIAARVWYAVVDNDAALLDRFDASYGCRLTTYLAAIARDVMSRHFRSEIRRHRREAVALDGRQTAAQPELPVVSLKELRETLTPAEKRFYDNVLTGSNGAVAENDYSKTNAWQLTSRIRAKLRHRLDAG